MDDPRRSAGNTIASYAVSVSAGLFVTGYGYGDDARTAGAIMTAWDMLPAAVQRRIADYWQKGRNNDLSKTVPTVDLLMPFIQGAYRAINEPKCACSATVVTQNGNVLEFDSVACDKLSEASLLFFIARELANVYFRSLGEPLPEILSVLRHEDEDANRCAAEWIQARDLYLRSFSA